MRRGIEHEGWRHLTYEIRAIVAVANELKKLGVEITWENIGDPVQKGEKIPQWIKDIVIQLVSEDKTYGYVATQRSGNEKIPCRSGKQTRRVSNFAGRYYLFQRIRRCRFHHLQSFEEGSTCNWTFACIFHTLISRGSPLRV